MAGALEQVAKAAEEFVASIFGPSVVVVPPGHPGNAVPHLLESSMKDLLGPAEWARFSSALPPSPEMPEFVGGLVIGAGKAAVDTVTEDIEFARDCVGGVLSFYKLVYDPNVWDPMLRAWLDRTAPPSAVMDVVRTDHPDVYAAIGALPGLSKQFDRLAVGLGDDTDTGSGWSRAAELITELWAKMAEGLGKMLLEQYEAVIAATGDAQEQGEIVGRVIGRVVIEVVMIATGLYAIVRSAAKAAGKAALKVAREAFHPAELARVKDAVKGVAPDIAEAARDFRRTANEAERIYDALALKKAPYKRLTGETYEFNRQIRDTYGFKLADKEYVELRLDAHHIIEGRYYDDFAEEFRTKLGWQAADEMDAMALHTTWHIRSGDRLSVRYKLLGGEGEPSLTQALMRMVDDRTPAGGYKNLRELLDAYEGVYKDYARTMYDQKQLGAWFASIRAKL